MTSNRAGALFDFTSRSRTRIVWAGLALPLLVATLALTRLLYEAAFPHWLWLAQPFPVFSLALPLALLAAWVWQRRWPALAVLPLLLNLLWLVDPTIDLTRSRLIFAASLLLPLLILRPSAWLLHPAIFAIYLFTLGRTVGRADTFEFQVVAPQLGIAHPTGYPLYLLLGKLWTELIPFGAVAWRLNVGTAVYALLALIFLYLAARRLLDQPIPALLAALALGVTPTFWSQSVEAEVYTLHALIISAAFWLMLPLADGRQPLSDRRLLALCALLGLGMTNHLTTVFLFPAAALVLLATLWHNRHQSPIATLKSQIANLFPLLLAFAAPLTLYAYLPLRWYALHGEAMGMGRFVDWVLGGRFQGALQWRAWLDDPARYEIVARLFWQNWGWVNLSLVGVGLIYLAVRQRRAALLLLLTWLGFTFYALNYYVPDLDVFLLGAQVVMGLWWAAGAAALWQVARRLGRGRETAVAPLLSTLLCLPLLLLALQTWPQVDRSRDDGLTQWGTAVLRLPLAPHSAILADSEKIAPLYYLQQAEGIRPDLTIMVLPDEAAYRAELDARLAAGQTVYLARYLPGLEGIYHLRSLGPLTEVSTVPLRALPQSARAAELRFGALRLLGYEVVAVSDYAPRTTAVTLYWQAATPPEAFSYVYIRWQGQPPLRAIGQHPVDNYYPTLAWRGAEIVPDFYLLPHPISATPQTAVLQIALAPPFTPVAELAWQTVMTVTLPATGELPLQRPLRIQLSQENRQTTLSGVQFPAQIRPQTPLPLLLSGSGVPLRADAQVLVPDRSAAFFAQPISYLLWLELGAEDGRYPLMAWGEGETAVCGWLQTRRSTCNLGVVEISGVPLPANAANFDDKIALLDIAIPDTRLTPGGELALTLTWQGLAPLGENYTVFVQVLDAADRIVGQVDAWPVQGTRPTSQWLPGQRIVDPYRVPLRADMPPGEYRLIVGWYLLADLRRLPLLDESGVPIADRVLVEGLVVRP